jgi:hypothetical protein
VTVYSQIPGIETEFDGVTYRSVLEAKWACTFKLLGLHFEYEPLPLAGFLPDFLVDVSVYAGKGKPRQHPTLVEIKPAWSPRDYQEPISKVARSGWCGPAVILGATVRANETLGQPGHWCGYAHPEVAERHAEDGSREWFQIGWDDKLKAFALGANGDLTAIWKQAGRIVRWLPPR